jgi:hypothetical protein
MNKLPIYRAIIDNEEAGMVTISLVDFPATESDFVAFEKEKELQKFAIENEEKHIVRGLVMAANMLIYRIHPIYGEYYIYYDAQTLRTMAERYLKNNFQNNVDLNHNGELVEGVDMVQFFIKDSENGINPKGFEDYADGSLFAEFHINNEEVWEQVKNGDFKGFSLEGYFGIEPTGQEFKQETNNNEEKYNKTMSKLNRIKEVLRSLLIECGEVSTDKGVIVFDGDELEAGMDVHTIDEEGNEVQLEDGEYRTEDKKVIVVEGGKVTEIRDDEAEVANDEPAEEPQENADEEEPAAEEPAAEEPATDDKDELIKQLQDRIAELEAENEELKAKIAELEAEPAAPNAEEAFEQASEKNDNSKAAKLRAKGYKF